jgi:hypothetical protein
MPAEWTQKQERKYEHIVASERESGESTRRSKEIAARTINKERARRGRTKAQLMNEARRRNIRGRSSMSKAELERAVAARTRS